MKHPLLSLLLVLVPCLLAAQGPQTVRDAGMEFSHIGVEDGLSQGTVNTICQDAAGNMWFGTDHGINCYDGYRMRSYTFGASGLPGDRITNIHLGPDSKIWASCENALILYEENRDVFSTVWTDPGAEDIYDFCFVPEDPDGRILIGSRFSICCYNPRTGGKDEAFVPHTMRSVRVGGFFVSGKKLYIACRGKGNGGVLYKWDFERNEITTVDLGGYNSNLNKVIACGDTVWVATESTGLVMSTLSKNSVQRSTKRFTTADGMCSNIVRAVLKDREGRIWAATFNGVNILEGDRITGMCRNDSGDPASISHNTVRSLFEDSQGGIWLGNYYFGADYYHPLRNRFNGTKNTLGDSALEGKIVSCVTADSKDGSLWLGVVGEGVFHYGATAGPACKYVLSQTSPQRLNHNDIKAVYSNPYDGMVYVGAHAGGFQRIDPSSGKVKLISDASLDNVYCIVPLGRDTLLVGALNGLFAYDTGSEKYERIDSEIRVRAIQVGLDGTIWTGGANGIGRLNRDCTALPVPDSLKRVLYVHDIFCSSAGILYFSTDNGLFGYDPQEDKVVRYSTANGLSENTVCAVREDGDGKIWVSTSNGLNCINPYLGETRRYYKTDGLKCSQFSRSSSEILEDGTLVFGTLKGVVSFNPETTKDNPFSPNARITALDIDGRLLPQKDGEVRLEHDNNFVTLSFSTPNYLAGQHSTFAFKTDLADGVWHYISSKPTLNFANIRPGKYYIEVKAANNNLKWCASPTRLVVVIMPAWYQTIGFKLFLILLFAVLLLLGAKRLYDRWLRILEERRRAEMAAMDKDFLAKAEETVRRNLRDPDFSTTQFAETMCVSRSTLYTKLKSLTGESAHDFIRRIRFAEACRLLKEDKPLPISDISERAGFRSVSYFSTAFKAYVGCLPSEYKKKAAETDN